MQGLWSPTESEASDSEGHTAAPEPQQTTGARKFKFFAATRMRIINNPRKLVSSDIIG